jgi:hypothetical protein
MMLGAGTASAQNPTSIDFTQVTRPVVQVTDRDLIDFLLFELIIEPMERPTQLQIIDVTQNGYGPDDVIVAYPTVETFLIPEWLPDTVQVIMGAWAPEVEFRMDAGNLGTDALAALIGTDARARNRAESAIMYDVVQALERNYHDLPVGILFERDSIGFTFQLWDYNSSAMDFTPRPAFVSDSAVGSVLELLQDVGYLPGESGEGALGVGRASPRIASVDQVISAIGTVEDEEARQLAARTVLVGSFDFDRSGGIDAAREVDAIPCTVWVSLEQSFSGFLTRYGFADLSSVYLGNMVFSISETVRAPVGRRASACLEGTAPQPTFAGEMDAGAGARTPLPGRVGAFMPLDAAADLVRATDGMEGGSAQWSAAVRGVLVTRYDTDSSGTLNGAVEIASVPCEVWQAIGALDPDFLDDLGFAEGEEYFGDRIGVDVSRQATARARATQCLADDARTVARRVTTHEHVTEIPEDRRLMAEARALSALSRIGGVEEEARRHLAARTILIGNFDFDRSGSIDDATELDAITCSVWTTLIDTFPGFIEDYGFSEADRPYRGSLLFDISTRLRTPAGRRVRACARGETPPPTLASEVPPAQTSIQLPVALRQFLDTETAVAVAREASDFEPGSARWALAVRGTLVGAFDLDRSGMLDAAAEVEEVPCIVWNTIRATSGRILDALGFGGTGTYLGDRIGIAPSQRAAAGDRIHSCAL